MPKLDWVCLFFALSEKQQLFPWLINSKSNWKVLGCPTWTVSTPHHILSWSGEKYERKWGKLALLCADLVTIQQLSPSPRKVWYARKQWWLLPICMPGMNKFGWRNCMLCPTLKFAMQDEKTAGQMDEHDWSHRSMLLLWISNYIDPYVTLTDF